MNTSRQSLSKWKILILTAVILSAETESRPMMAQVPAPYEAVYSSMDSSVTAFSNAMDSAWNGTRAPVAFSAELTSASSILGGELLRPHRFAGVLYELNSLKALGVSAVSIQMSFPVLHPGFYSSQSEYLSYVDFYTRVVQAIRERGLQVIVRCGLISSLRGSSVVDPTAFYARLTLEQYIAGRAEVSAMIARQFRPDYLVLLNEPDIESVGAGKVELGTIAGSTGFLRSLITAVQSTGVGGIQIGAGIGSWTDRYADFIRSYAATPIHFIDCHVYPVNRDFLSRLPEMADLAASFGKKFSISEAWLQKILDEELGITPLVSLFGRDTLSFWAPLDQKFLGGMVKFAHHKKLAFLSPFWSQYLHHYLDYSTVSSLSPSQLLTKSIEHIGSSIERGEYTSTGLAYASMIAAQPDLTPPSAPAAVRGLAMSGNDAHLSWSASEDNVGVAGYTVYRNGVRIGSTAVTTFIDSGLSANTSYAYSVTAYDAALNSSPPTTSFSVLTTNIPDSIKPTVPTGLSAQVLTAAQIEIRWIPAADNVRTTKYKVYRNGIELAETVWSSYSDTALSPATTYWYSVAAVDGAGNVSGRSAVVSARTAEIDRTPPSAPGNLRGIAGRDVVHLTWSVSVDDVALAGYEIYRNGAPIARFVGTYYRDETILSSTTYTYFVVAVDYLGNRSAASTQVTVTTPDTTAPTTPLNLTQTRVSATAIQLTWLPASDNVRVAGYRIMRNGAFLANWGPNSYTDSGLNPGTDYIYTVAALDYSGNVSQPSAPASVRTLTADRTPPSASVMQRAYAISPTQIFVQWSAGADDVEVAGYALYRNGALVTTTPHVAYLDTGLSPGTSYSYTVVVYDASSNASPASTAIVGSTHR